MKYLICIDGSIKSREAAENILKYRNKENDEIYFVSVYPPHPKENETITNNSTITKMVIEMFSGIPDLVDPEEENNFKNECILKSNKKKCKALDEFNYFKTNIFSKNDVNDQQHIHYLLVASNDIPHSITKVSDKYNIDCIVMGSTGLSGIQKLLIGSVSSQVLQMSHCSVLISH